MEARGEATSAQKPSSQEAYGTLDHLGCSEKPQDSSAAMPSAAPFCICGNANTSGVYYYILA